MYYFDNEYLKDYIDVGSELMVYAHGQWLNVPDISDIADEHVGTGYDQYGKPIDFKYKEISQIKADSHQFTIDQLQGILGNVQPIEPQSPKSPDVDDEEHVTEPGSEKSIGKTEGVLSRDFYKKLFNERATSREYIGMLVENVDQSCEYFGTVGVVNKVYPKLGVAEYILYTADEKGNIGRKIAKSTNLLRKI